jgi:hypothetical protein
MSDTASDEPLILSFFSYLIILPYILPSGNFQCICNICFWKVKILQCQMAGALLPSMYPLSVNGSGHDMRSFSFWPETCKLMLQCIMHFEV